MIGYLLGLLTAASVAQLSLLIWPALLVALLSLLSYWRGARIRHQVLSYLLALLWGWLWGGWQLAERIPATAGRVDLQIVAEVSNIQRRPTGDYQRLELSVSQASVYPQLDRLVVGYYAAEPAFKAGDRLSALVRINAPSSYLNPGSVDRMRADLQAGIDGRGYVRELLWHQSAPNLRQRLFDLIARDYSPSAAAFLAALVLGERWSLSNSDRDLLVETGTIHLVVVSGLHLTVVAAAGYLLAQLPLLFAAWLGMAVSRPVLRRLPLLMSLAFATGYLWLGGAGVPLQRAWIMLLVLIVGQCVDNPPAIVVRFKLAFILVTLFDPLAPLQLGFWLSFLLVAILISTACWRSRRSGFAKLLRVQWVLAVLMMPVLLVGVGQINLIGMIANLWAIPWISLGVMLLPIALPLASLTGGMTFAIEAWIELFWQALRLHQQAGLHVAWTQPVLSAALLAFCGGILLLAPLRLRLVAPLLFLPALFPLQRMPEIGDFSVEIYDVGQGQAVRIHGVSHQVIYDSGPAYHSGRAAIEFSLLPRIVRSGPKPVDLLVLSHSDSDHSGGTDRLLDQLEVRRRVSGQPELTGGEPCQDQQLLLDGVTYRWFKIAGFRPDNDNSCVLRVDNGICSLLLAGDLSERAEKALIDQYLPAPVTWLLLSHHGSKSSSSDPWLQRLNPELALISRGRYNRWNHPSTEVIERLNRLEIDYLDTGRDGALYLDARGEECKASSFLDLQRRYWH